MTTAQAERDAVEARASVVKTERVYRLFEGPQIADRDERPFIAEHVLVHHMYCGQRVWVFVRGRGVRKDGTIGRTQRSISYLLAGVPRADLGVLQDHAPEWLRAALEAAGEPFATLQARSA